MHRPERVLPATVPVASTSRNISQNRAMPWRSNRGRTNHFSGLAAEHSVARMYLRQGATVQGQRVRTPEGELDLIVLVNGVLVFVEVKKRRRLHAFDSPISRKQWDRLEKASLHYMMDIVNETGVQPVCRFDVALMGPDGSVDIIENAWSFDAQ